MPAFVSPLIDPAAWTYSIREITIAAGLRYAGYTVRALRAERPAGANIVMPALGVLRQVTGADSREYIEVQTDPFPIRNVIAGLSGGLPAFYLVFPDATGLAAIDGQIAAASEVLRSGGTDVTIAVMFQDRVTRDPALWASQILAAMTALQSNSTLWQPFANAVSAQTNSGNRAPVLLLDQTGEPVRSGDIDLVFGSGAGQARRVTMAASDRRFTTNGRAAQSGRSRTLVGRKRFLSNPAGASGGPGVPARFDRKYESHWRDQRNYSNAGRASRVGHRADVMVCAAVRDSYRPDGIAAGPLHPRQSGHAFSERVRILR
jgi:hypothetical protein